ncbi:MAG: glycerophosphodiester phosphodiesterase family protein [Firmicutes bacterium]|nr:glycerophosphodiester phosphodiesterase family protein [Bacillota bacterium]
MKGTLQELAQEKIIIVAHRGVFGGNIPCNNLAAYDIALKHGADMIEIDVTKSADDELFIFHPKMERAHLNGDVDIRTMTAAEIKKLRYVNIDDTPTDIGLNTLDEVFEHFKGRCFINVDKFWDCPELIIEKIKRHNIQDQILLKSSPKPEILDMVEDYAPDIPFMPIISEDQGIHEYLQRRNINYIGSELLFTTEDSEVASEEYIAMLHRDGKLAWSNAIVYDYKAVLAAGHSDDESLINDPANGWGWLADRNFDFIQTDWVLACVQYLKETGRLYRR